MEEEADYYLHLLLRKYGNHRSLGYCSQGEHGAEIEIFSLRISYIDLQNLPNGLICLLGTR